MEAKQEEDEQAQVERKIGECIAADNWRKVIDLGQEMLVEKRVKFLWAWPLQDDLHQIGSSLAQLNISRVISVGCGTGLLEWLIARVTGVVVAGVEKDESWWQSKYATKTYIPMVFAENGDGELREDSAWQAMMFCYFNDGQAFRDYVNGFDGRYVIIIGPEVGRGIYTDPLPFEPTFPAEQCWSHLLSFPVGSENLNHVVIYQRQ